MAQVRQFPSNHRHTPRRGGAIPSGNNWRHDYSGSQNGSRMDPAREAIAMMDTKTKFLPHRYRRPDGGGDAA
jgi:hypothetical protein